MTRPVSESCRTVVDRGDPLPWDSEGRRKQGVQCQFLDVTFFLSFLKVWSIEGACARP